MFREIKGTKQRSGEPTKRWFSSLNMDLFIWFDDDDEIVSYQLTYNKPHDEKALTWSKDKGYVHLGVDDGSNPGKHPGTPLLVKDGVVSPSSIIKLIRNDQGDLKPWIKNFIVEGIEKYFNGKVAN